MHVYVSIFKCVRIGHCSLHVVHFLCCHWFCFVSYVFLPMIAHVSFVFAIHENANIVAVSFRHEEYFVVAVVHLQIFDSVCIATLQSYWIA